MEEFTEESVSSTIFEDLGVDDGDDCLPLKKSFLLPLMFVPALVALENICVLLVMISHWETLSKRSINAYVSSMVTANFLLSLMIFYHFLNYYFGFESVDPTLWWAFRKGLTLSMSLVMLGNIGLFIYGIDDNTYIVGRNSDSSQKSSNLSPTYRRRKALLLIFSVWLLPILYGSLSMTPWNCTLDHCTCTLRYQSNKPICFDESCSHLFTPMAKSYLFSIALLSALEHIILIGFILNSVIAVRRKRATSERSFTVLQAFKVYVETHRLVFYLYGLFFICTSPVMVLVILDFVFPLLSIPHEVLNVVMPLPLVYSLASPGLICYHMSDIRRAVVSFCSLVCSCKNKRKTIKKEAKNESKEMIFLSKDKKREVKA